MRNRMEIIVINYCNVVVDWMQEKNFNMKMHRHLGQF